LQPSAIQRTTAIDETLDVAIDATLNAAILAWDRHVQHFADFFVFAFDLDQPTDIFSLSKRGWQQQGKDEDRNQTKTVDGALEHNNSSVGSMWLSFFDVLDSA